MFSASVGAYLDGAYGWVAAGARIHPVRRTVHPQDSMTWTKKGNEHSPVYYVPPQKFSRHRRAHTKHEMNYKGGERGKPMDCGSGAASQR